MKTGIFLYLPASLIQSCGAKLNIMAVFCSGELYGDAYSCILGNTGTIDPDHPAGFNPCKLAFLPGEHHCTREIELDCVARADRGAHGHMQ